MRVICYSFLPTKSTKFAVLTKALVGEKDDERAEMGVVARGIARSASVLTNRYHHIFTNPPYLTIKKQASLLKLYCEKNYQVGKHDVATVFLMRLKDLLKRNGDISIVLPQNWTFQPSYTEFRKTVVCDGSMKLIARLGSGAFDSISGEIVKGVLLLLGIDVESRNWYAGLDVSQEIGTARKSEGLVHHSLVKINIAAISEANDYVVRLTENQSCSDSLTDYSISMRGVVSGDNDKWMRKFFEIVDRIRWMFYQGTPGGTAFYTGKVNVIDWSDSGSEMLRPGSKNEAYGRKGVAVGQIGNLPATLFGGEFYDNSTGVLVPHNEKMLAMLWSYLSSSRYSANVRP
jgi:hypothetical protein